MASRYDGNSTFYYNLGLDHGSVALSHVLERNQVYVTRGGTKSGIHEAPSKQILEDYFQTSDMQDIVETILEGGEIHQQFALKVRSDSHQANL